MHFFFAFGAFVAPLLIKLSQDTLGGYHYAWWFISAFMVPVVVALFFYESPQDKSRHGDENHEASERTSPFPNWGKDQWGIVLLTAAYLFLYVGVEVGTSNLLVSFVEDRQLADRDTAYSINATFWGGMLTNL